METRGSKKQLGAYINYNVFSVRLSLVKIKQTRYNKLEAVWLGAFPCLQTSH